MQTWIARLCPEIIIPLALSWKTFCHTLVKVEVEVETRVGFIIRKKNAAATNAAATSGPLLFF